MLRWDPDDYHRHSSAQFEAAMEMISRLRLSGNERVLDIGCGDGKITVEISRLLTGGSVVGIDSSVEMIEFARKKYPQRDYPNLSWDIMDASNLTFDGEFDVVFSNACLHWVSDHLPVLKGIKRSLKPGGLALLQMRGRGEIGKLEEALMAMLQREEWGRYFSSFSHSFGFHEPEDYHAWLRQAGLTPRRVELVKRDMVHAGREGMAGHIRTTWLPFTLQVPEVLREKFIYELVDTYIEHSPPDDSGIVHVPSYRLVVEAVNRNP